MRVTVRLSGELARIGGVARIPLELDDGATVDTARSALLTKLPELDGAVQATLPVIAGQHVGDHHALSAGDELALLLPAAGG